MGKIKDETHQKKNERLNNLIVSSGMKILGFSSLLGVSEKYIYAILNGNKPYSEKFEKRIEISFNFSKGSFSDFSVPLDIDRIQQISKKHLKNNKHNAEDFFNLEPKISDLIKRLNDEGFFKKKRSIKEVVKACEDSGAITSSDKLTNTLIYLVQIGILTKGKELILKKDGTRGERLVNYYWEP